MALILQSEGTVPKTYKDPVGILTDCTGHTGADVVWGKVNTPYECKLKLATDMLEANRVVDSCVHVPLNQYQRSALVDFAFNVGPGRKGVKDGLCALKGSGKPSTLATLHNAGKYAQACAEYRKWGNPPLPGIIKRRAAEEAMCLKSTHP